jgi:uncharacterized protein involved in exopolysaccharide biosynthesis
MAHKKARSSMNAYRATFRRHRALLVLPVAIAVVFALWSAFGAPPQYDSHATLWVDTAPPAASSVDGTTQAVTPPADQEQQVLAELLRTRQFRLTVARAGPLSGWLARNDTEGWSPTALLSTLRGSRSPDDRMLEALDERHVAFAIEGPQLLSVSYSGPTPALSTATLHALINAFRDARARLNATRGQGTVAYYRAQRSAASTAVDDATANLRRYIEAHPGVRTSDPTVTALRRAREAARTQLFRVTAGLNQAVAGVAGDDASADEGGGARELTLLDAPSPGVSPAGARQKAMALLAGLFAGGLVSLLGLIALTPTRPELAAPVDAARAGVAVMHPQPAPSDDGRAEPIRRSSGS